MKITGTGMKNTLDIYIYFLAKKWIYSDSERSTLHRQSVGHHKG